MTTLYPLILHNLHLTQINVALTAANCVATAANLFFAIKLRRTVKRLVENLRKGALPEWAETA